MTHNLYKMITWPTTRGKRKSWETKLKQSDRCPRDQGHAGNPELSCQYLKHPFTKFKICLQALIIAFCSPKIIQPLCLIFVNKKVIVVEVDR